MNLETILKREFLFFFPFFKKELSENKCMVKEETKWLIILIWNFKISILMEKCYSKQSNYVSIITI